MSGLMDADFDPEDRNCWYFGLMPRDDANSLINAESQSGVFLVRDSVSIRGDFVLSVKEDAKVSHYIINRINVAGMTRFRIGDQEFPDLPSLLNFYKTHYLDTTSLIRPVRREQFVAKYDFPGRDPEDLPFKKGDVLTILQRDEDQWWTARNSQGKIGQVPVPYIVKHDPSAERTQSTPEHEPPQYTRPEVTASHPAPIQAINGQRQLPATAIVIQQRIPSAYDRTALKLEVGEKVTVTAMNPNGQWEGEINGRKGFFPFTHVRFDEEAAS